MTNLGKNYERARERHKHKNQNKDKRNYSNSNIHLMVPIAKLKRDSKKDRPLNFDGEKSYVSPTWGKSTNKSIPEKMKTTLYR